MIGSIGQVGSLGLSTLRPKAWTTELWLDAADAATIFLSGSTLSQWNDKSGNGLNLFQSTAASQPLYVPNGLNGLPVVRNVNNNFMSSGSSNIGRNQPSLSIFAVVKYGPITPTQTTALVFVSTGTQITTTRSLIGTTAVIANNPGVAGRRLDTDLFNEIASNTSYASIQGQWIIQESEMNYEAARARMWINGALVLDSNFQAPGNTSDTRALGASVFATPVASFPAPSGTELAEARIINGRLSTSARQEIRNRLAQKWALY